MDSLGPNWKGLTKMTTITTSALSAAARISPVFPVWSAPIVGTRAIVLPSARS